MAGAGTRRRRGGQLVMASIGAVLALLMGFVLFVGVRLATHLRADIIALQTSSTLQNYPAEISRQLNTLRDRLEVRAVNVHAGYTQVRVGCGITMAGKVLDRGQHADLMRAFDVRGDHIADLLGIFSKRTRIDDGIGRI